MRARTRAHTHRAQLQFYSRMMQVAYFRVYRACICSYETIMTKAFFHGRTEAGCVDAHESMRAYMPVVGSTSSVHAYNACRHA